MVAVVDYSEAGERCAHNTIAKPASIMNSTIINAEVSCRICRMVLIK
jgi:hypothetical protein